VLDFELAASLSVSYGFAFVFQGPAIHADLSTTQVRASVIPEGSITAHVSAAIDLLIFSGSIDAHINLITLAFPVTIAATLDGSSSCYSIGLDSSFLTGEVSLNYDIALCFVDCSDSIPIFTWQGYEYKTILSAAGCCGGSSRAIEGGHSMSERTYIRAGTGSNSDPVAGTFKINGFSKRPQWKTTVTFKNSAPPKKGGVPRVVKAVSTIRTKNKRILDSKSTNPTKSVRDYLKRDSNYRTGSDNAGHILAATLGGSNTDKRNFFAQHGTVNKGAFRVFEGNIKQCLLQNTNLYAVVTMKFSYNFALYDTIRPNSYEIKVTFKTNAGATAPANTCASIIKPIYKGSGSIHMDYDWNQ